MPRKKQQGDAEPVNGTAVVDNPNGDTAANSPIEEKTQPAHTIRMRNVRAAIWANARPDNSVWYSTTFSRSYRDEGGNWHSTDNFGVQDLLIHAEVSRAAFLWIVAATQGGEIPF